MRFLLRLLFRLLLVLIVVVPLIMGIGIVMAVGDRALVPISGTPSSRDVARAKRLFARYDPRKLKAGAVKNAAIKARDVNLLTNHAINLITTGGAIVDVRRGGLTGRASVELPRNPVGRYLNVEAELQAGDGLPHFERLRVAVSRCPAGWQILRLCRCWIGTSRDRAPVW